MVWRTEDTALLARLEDEEILERLWSFQVGAAGARPFQPTPPAGVPSAAGAARESLLKGIEASDTFNYMQAKIVREAVYTTASASQAPDPETKIKWETEARRLRQPDAAKHGIDQLQAAGKTQREDGVRAAKSGEGYEMGETALQLAIVLLSIAMVARSAKLVAGATAFAIAGMGVAIVTAFGLPLT